MVPNGTAYSNYPPFANNGTKTPPGGSTESAKYALGMVPADTFPAEWANYLFHGATEGITRLNQDTGSIKKEINSVLSNYNITPNATLNNQLLEALTKLKAEAALAAHPVGSLYWTSSSENPATTFGGGTWVQIKDTFILAAGDTYSAGDTGGAAEVTLTVQQIPSHSHTQQGSFTSGNPSDRGTSSNGNHRHSWSGLAEDGDSFGYGSPYTFARGSTNNSGTFTVNTAYEGSHSHTINNHTHATTISGETRNSGGSQAHNNMPPYTVRYCWERTA